MTTTHYSVAVDIDCRPVYYRAYRVDPAEFRAGYEAAMQRDDSDEVPDDLTPSEADGWRLLAMCHVRPPELQHVPDAVVADLTGRGWVEAVDPPHGFAAAHGATSLLFAPSAAKQQVRIRLVGVPVDGLLDGSVTRWWPLDPPARHSPAGYVSPAAQPPSTSVGHQQLGGQ